MTERTLSHRGRPPGQAADEENFAPVARHASVGFAIVEVNAPAYQSFHFTLTALDGESMPGMAERLKTAVSERDATLIWIDVFGRGEDFQDGMAALAEAAGDESWPVMWLDSDKPEIASPLALQAFAVTGVAVEDVTAHDRVIGKRFETELAHFVYLSDLRGPDSKALRMTQAQAVYTDMRVVLGQFGMEFADVVRTWLYMDRILDWYDDFNDVRTSFYRSTGVLGHTLPASTGIGARIPAGGAIVAKVLAVRPKTHKLRTFATPSPLQCPAFDYASAFSRAIEVDSGTQRDLYVSGTASIEPGGRTMHLDDIARQVDLTMGVLKQLLKSRGMDWSDVTRAIAYFKDLSQAGHLAAYLDAHDLPPLPVVYLQSEVCREELLFEIEIDAVSLE